MANALQRRRLPHDEPMPAPKAIYAKHEGKCSCDRGVGVGQSVLWINTAGVVGCRHCASLCGMPEQGGESHHPLRCTEMVGHEDDHIVMGIGGQIFSRWINREPPRSQYATVDDVRRLYGDDGQPHLFGVAPSAPTQVSVSGGQRTRLRIGDWNFADAEVDLIGIGGNSSARRLSVMIRCATKEELDALQPGFEYLWDNCRNCRTLAVDHPMFKRWGVTHVKIERLNGKQHGGTRYEVAMTVESMVPPVTQKQQAMTDAFRAAAAEPLPIYGATFHRALPTGAVVPYRCVSIMGATRSGQLGAVLLAEDGDTHVVDCATIDSARVEWFRSADNASRAARHMLAESAPTLVKHETSPLRLACMKAIAEYTGMHLTAYTRAVTHLAEPMHGLDLPPAETVWMLQRAMLAVEQGVDAGHTWKRVKRDVDEAHCSTRYKHNYVLREALAVYVRTRRGHTRG